MQIKLYVAVEPKERIVVPIDSIRNELDFLRIHSAASKLKLESSKACQESHSFVNHLLRIFV